MIPVFEPEITEQDISAVAEAMRRGEISGSFGESIPAFEREFAAFCGAKHGVSVTSGTTALHLAVDAAGVREGDEVLISASTNIATALAVFHNGAVPVPVDSEDVTWNLDLDLLEGLITPRTKAIIPVHLFGHPVDMDRLCDIARRHKLVVIEDCAESHGATWHGRMTGAFGDMGCYSFYANKIITTGEGGMVLCNNPVYANTLRRLRSHGISSDPADMQLCPADEIWNYQQLQLGFNYRMTELQAALGLSQLKKLTMFVRKRHALAKGYDRALADMPLLTPWQHPHSYSSYHLYPIQIPAIEDGPTQQQVYQSMQAAGVQVNLHYIPVYLQPHYARLGFQRGYCPHAEAYFKQTISLPLHAGLSADEQLYVCQQLATAFHQVIHKSVAAA